MSTPVTKRETHEALELWSGFEEHLDAMLAAFDARVDAKLEAWATRLSKELSAVVSAEMARWAKSFEEFTRTMIKRLGAKHTDLPRRMKRLEHRVRPPQRRRRR